MREESKPLFSIRAAKACRIEGCGLSLKLSDLCPLGGWARKPDEVFRRVNRKERRLPGNRAAGALARGILAAALLVVPPLAVAGPVFPVAAVLHERMAATPTNVAGAAWLADYRQDMRDARAGYGYALAQPLANLEARLDAMAPAASALPGQGDWVAARQEDELVGLAAPNLDLRQDVLRGHINPRPVEPLLIAGAVRITWLPRTALRQTLDRAEAAIAEHAGGDEVWHILQGGFSQVRKVSYLQDGRLLHAYGFLEAAQAVVPLNGNAAKVLLRRAAGSLGRAGPAPVAYRLRDMTQGQPQAYAIGALALQLKERIAQRALFWFAHARAPVRHLSSLSAKGISASSS